MFSRHRVRFITARLLFPFLLLASLFVQAAEPQNKRSTEFKELLRKLHTTARLMQITAHPDDEDGGLLTMESRGKGADVLLLTLTRGEGGQNKVGSNLLDVLGELRTLELLAADKYYGVQQRFTRVADFGFSKTADETFQKWQGHDAALGDMVRAIRTFRPDVLVSRFSGTPRDGHGHHQASGILTIEAFRAAADPNRFPEQIEEGITTWQAKKLYIGTRSPEDATLALNTGEVDPLLGMSYAQYAMQGLKHQLSQGAGSWELQPGPRYSYYKLVDSVLPAATREKDFFDGIDISMNGLASRLGQDKSAMPYLRPALAELESNIRRATAAADRDMTTAALPLLAGLKIADNLIREIELSERSWPAKQEKTHICQNQADVGHRPICLQSLVGVQDVLDRLKTKRNQLQRAANLALGITAVATVDAPPANAPDDVFVAVPGQSFSVSVTNIAADNRVVFGKTVLNLPVGWSASPMPDGKAGKARFRVTVPDNASFTRPYWHRDNPENDTIYTLDKPQYATLPFVPPALSARTEYSVNGSLAGTVSTPIEISYRSADEIRTMPLAVAPALSVMLEPAMLVLPVAIKDGADMKVTVQKNVADSVRAAVRLQLPTGWRGEPATALLDMNAGERRTSVSFHVTPARLQQGRDLIRAVVEHGCKAYSEGYTVVTRPDLGTAFYYQPAAQHISVVDVKVPHNLKVGYITGAGDDIPTVLRQVGMNVSILSEQELATGDLSGYGTIVLGIRAYDTREDVRKYNQRLLDFVQRGGTLLVQYNASVGEFNAGHFTPYPAEMSRERVTVEEAPVEILDRQNPIFPEPNQITPEDFKGWVQERGLYFASSWDPNFKPMIESSDPGEPPLKGGLLYARYGKGIYIYTGYSFFRQLPAGVPGAIRLFVNLVSTGR